MESFFSLDSFIRLFGSCLGLETAFFVAYAMKRGWTRWAIVSILFCALIGFLWCPVLTSCGITSDWILSQEQKLKAWSAIATGILFWSLHRRKGQTH